jgi:hypothetical protein
MHLVEPRTAGLKTRKKTTIEELQRIVILLVACHRYNLREDLTVGSNASGPWHSGTQLLQRREPNLSSLDHP